MGDALNGLVQFSAGMRFSAEAAEASAVAASAISASNFMIGTLPFETFWTMRINLASVKCKASYTA